MDYGLRTAGSDTRNHDTAVERWWACRTRTAYGPQRCNVVLVGAIVCCLLSTRCISGMCAHESRGQKKIDDVLPARNIPVRNNASRTETREIVLFTPAEKRTVEGLPRAPHCTDRARTSTDESGRAFLCRLTLSVLPKKCSYEEACSKKYETIHMTILTYDNRYLVPGILFFWTPGKSGNSERGAVCPRSFFFFFLSSDGSVSPVPCF